MRKTGFKPVVDDRIRLLVCGSLPGDASLRAAQYYAHPRNLFWQLIGSAAGIEDLPALPYEDRLAALLGRGIGLWDVARSARRRGSLDAAMRDVSHADLPALAARLPQLAAIGFNGATAARIGRRMMVNHPRIALIDLPSSSPAYAAMTRAEKLARWSALSPWIADRRRSGG